MRTKREIEARIRSIVSNSIGWIIEGSDPVQTAHSALAELSGLLWVIEERDKVDTSTSLERP